MSSVGSQMLDAYQEATGLALRLSDLPRWRRRARRETEQKLDAACQRADELRDRLGAKPGAEPLREIIDRTIKEMQ